MIKRITHRLGFGLSRELWLVEIGIFLNYLGYGAVLPFEIIYLHNGRGFDLSIAGLVVAMLSGVAVVTAPLAGPWIDRFGARTVATGAGAALAAGYAGLAFADSPVMAFLAAALAGAGNGALSPSQSTLIVSLAASDVRHRATAVSRVATNAGIGLGSALGGLIAAYGLRGYISLFLANGVTYLVYILVLVLVVREETKPTPIEGGYGTVLRDRAFMQLAFINVAIIAVGWGLFSWIMPPYAQEEIGIRSQLIGLLLLANAITVVIAQVPVARFAEGRRRILMIALAALIFVGACLLVVLAGLRREIAYAALLVASIAVALGECFYTAVLTPLVADIAPIALRGRYMASMGLSWWIGLALAPTFGTQVLSIAPTAVFLVGAAIAAVATISALVLEQQLPEASRLTPRPESPFESSTAPIKTR